MQDNDKKDGMKNIDENRSAVDSLQPGLGMGGIAKGSALILVGAFISILANLIYQVYAARHLGPAQVGIVNLGITIISLVSLLMVFGLDWAVVRFIGMYHGKQDRPREKGVTTSALLVLATTILSITPIFFLTANWLATQVFHKPELVPVLKIMGAGLPCIALTQVMLAIVRAYKHNRPILAVDQIAVPTLRVIGLVIFIHIIGPTSPTAALAFTVAAVIGSIPATYFARQIYKNQALGFKSNLIVREVFHFAWVTMLSMILNRMNVQTETLVLGVFSSSEQVGIYTTSLKATVFISIFLDVIAMVFTPFIAELYARRELKRLSQQLKTVTRWAFTLAFPVAIVLFIESASLMELLGAGFEKGAPILQILVLAQLANVLLGPGGMMLMMTDYTHFNFINAIFNLILSLVLDLTLIPHYGAWGAAIAGAITLILLDLLRLFQTRHVLKMHPFSRAIIKPLMAGLGAIIIAQTAQLFLQNAFYISRLLIVGSITLITYTGIIAILRLEGTDRELLEIFLRRLLREGNN